MTLAEHVPDRLSPADETCTDECHDTTPTDTTTSCDRDPALAGNRTLLHHGERTPGQIAVTFTADDKGFTATSDKDISNVIVELCSGETHKHDDLEGTSFTHTETQKILGIWVKSGNNGIGGDAPSGAGEHFDNEGVNCTPAPPPPSDIVCLAQADGIHVSWTAVVGATSYKVWRQVGSGPWIYIGSSNTTSYVDHTSASGQTYGYAVSSVGAGVESPRSDDTCGITAIPFFPSLWALGVGTASVLGAAVLMLRRRRE